MVQYRIHKTPSLESTLCQLKKVHIRKSYYIKICFSIIIDIYLKWSLSFNFYVTVFALYIFLTSTRNTWPAHPIITFFIILTTWAKCDILDSHSSVAEDLILLWQESVSSGKSFLTVLTIFTTTQSLTLNVLRKSPLQYLPNDRAWYFTGPEHSVWAEIPYCASVIHLPPPQVLS